MINGLKISSIPAHKSSEHCVHDIKNSLATLMKSGRQRHRWENIHKKMYNQITTNNYPSSSL